jgi:hypothetical protein
MTSFLGGAACLAVALRVRYAVSEPLQLLGAGGEEFAQWISGGAGGSSVTERASEEEQGEPVVE